MRSTILLLFGLLLLSCSKPPHPDKVNKVLALAGENRAELEKALYHFQTQGEEQKYKAACYLIGNMGNKHSYITFDLVDSTEAIVPWDVLSYTNYSELLNAWDSIENHRGEIHFKRKKTVPDHEVIKSDYLIKNIDQAFDAWQFPWANHLSFDQFCEYILPYRSTNEPLEEWRTYFLEEYAWLKDSMKNSDDPIRACSLINNEIRSWFRFDERFYEHPTDQGLSELLQGKKGRCEDMTNLAIMAMRAWGIAVMSDYTPYWANTGNNHAWNAILDRNGKTTIFMGGEANPLEYKLTNVKAKVYRKTFAKQAKHIMEVKNDWEQVPKYLNNSSQVDVTAEYGNVANVSPGIDVPAPDSVEFAYLCVFNSGKWKAIAYSKLDDKQETLFKNMGKSIAYLPTYFKNDEVIPAGPAFIFGEEGTTTELVASNSEKQSFSFTTTTKRTSGQTTDNIGKGNLKDNVVYQLFYWDGKWKLINEGMASNGIFTVNGIPTDALFWLKEKDGREEERIFTLRDNKQIWW